MPDDPYTSEDPDFSHSPAASDAPEDQARSHSSEDMWNDALTPDEEINDVLRPKSMESLRRLREQVEAAAEELVRLRQENAALRERLEELEGHLPTAPTEGTLLVLDDDPEHARRKVQHFIASIDRYLARNDTPS